MPLLVLLPAAIQEGKGRLEHLDALIDLKEIFSLHETRSVRKNGTITFKGSEYKVGQCPGEQVSVCLIPRVKLMVYKGKDKLSEYHL